jgi:ATP-dependent DNA helicase DinG
MLTTAIKNEIRQTYQHIAQHRSNFYIRKEQSYMIAQISKILGGEHDMERSIGIVEAGTGTGKSLAYLLGSIPLALHNQKKVCISTATVALQEQLVEHELPAFQADYAGEVNFVLVKGRRRYACLEKMQNLIEGVTPARAEQCEQLRELIARYQAHTWDGDLDQCPLPMEQALWQQIASDKHTCQRQTPGHEHCPFHIARDRLQDADVLVTNHHLLLADLALGGGIILPEPESMFFVIDEAHHLPTTTQQFTRAHVSIHNSVQWLKDIEVLISTFSKQVTLTKFVEVSQKMITTCIDAEAALTKIEQCLQQNLTWFDNAEQLHRFEMGQLPDTIRMLFHNSAITNKTCLQHASRLHQIVQDERQELDLKRHEYEHILEHLGQMTERFEQMQQLWQGMIQDDSQESAPWVRWLARQQQGQKTEFVAHVSPIMVDRLLEQLLWEKAAGVILCSATLRALGDFNYFLNQLGLKDMGDALCFALPSPFDYPKKGLLYAPTMPCEPNHPEFTSALIQILPKLIENEGATLVLFTSYQQMQEVAKALNNTLSIPLWVQGEQANHLLLAQHKQLCDQEQPSVLMGTMSFAEGLDLPGHYLTNLIITKIPFSVPTSPVEQAHAEYLKQMGQNPFFQLTLPEASKKLIQSCGRLLRHEDDFGRVVILDARLQTKGYGQPLLEALPPFARRLETPLA